MNELTGDKPRLEIQERTSMRIRQWGNQRCYESYRESPRDMSSSYRDSFRPLQVGSRHLTSKRLDGWNRPQPVNCLTAPELDGTHPRTLTPCPEVPFGGPSFEADARIQTWHRAREQLLQAQASQVLIRCPMRFVRYASFIEYLSGLPSPLPSCRSC